MKNKYVIASKASHYGAVHYPRPNVGNGVALRISPSGEKPMEAALPDS